MRAGRWLALGLAWLTVQGCTSPPSTTIESLYQTTESGGQETSSWANRAEFDLHDNIGPDFEYRVSETLVRDESRTKSGGMTTDFDSTLVHTSVDMAVTRGTTRWTQGVDVQDFRTDQDPGVDNDLKRVELLEKLEWMPFGLPKVTAWLLLRDDKDDLFVDREENQAVIEIAESRGAIDYFYSYRDQDIDDHASDVDRESGEHTFRGTYRDVYLDGALSSTFSVFADQRKFTNHVPSGGTGTLQIPALEGLSLLDTTPQVAILENTPELIDGDDTTATGINIGGFVSGGELNWNIGVRVDPGSELERIDLYTMDEVQPTMVDQFAFSVWASDDNNFWTLVTPSASFNYEQPFRRFRISMPAVSSRYVKVVNTSAPPTSPAVLVTEMEVFETTTVEDSTRLRSKDTTRSMTGQLSWRVNDQLQFSYDGVFQKVDRKSAGITTSDQTRIDNGLSGQWTPVPLIEASFRARHERIDDKATVDQDTTVVNGLLSFLPLETLEVDLAYQHTDRNVGGDDDVSSESFSLGGSALLLEGLEADLRFEVGTQDNDTASTNTDRTAILGSLSAELTRRLDLTVGMRSEDGTVSGSGSSAAVDPSEDRFEAIVQYRPSTLLTLNAEVEWVDGFTGSGWDQRYSMDWLPFQDGTIDIQLNFDRIDTNSTDRNSAIDRYQAQARWNVNDATYFELNYAAQLPEDGDRIDFAAVSFNYSR